MRALSPAIRHYLTLTQEQRAPTEKNPLGRWRFRRDQGVLNGGR